MVHPLTAKVDSLPHAPGVYLFKGARGRVLYVGKAKDLWSRVRQYLAGSDDRPMVPYLLAAATDVDVTEVRTEKEAIILENTLIKKHRPRYNVRLRDDSSFLHLHIDPGSPWPRYEVVRDIDAKGRHFGPYASAHRARMTMEFLSRRFPLRTCSDSELARRTRPCLLFQMHRCVAPCVDRCSQEEYAAIVDESALFLEGRNKELLQRLHVRMRREADEERFEEAARLRDLIRAVEASIEGQITVDKKGGNRDVWAIARSGERALAVLLPFRRGHMQEARPFPLHEVLGNEGEILSSLLSAWYANDARIPGEILTSVVLPDARALAEVLGERRGRAVNLRTPQRGDKVKAVALAHRNATSALRRERLRDARTDAALERLAEVARLPRRPHRIECFDNSNIQGSDPVASMVVFIDGVPDRKRYRRYRVRSIQGPDDYGTMREILERRVRRAQAETATAEDALPDLMVVDGGKGQVGVVLAVLADLGAHDLPVIGLAKPRAERARGDVDAVDKIVIPGIKDPQRLRSNDPALQLLQALRDESHRTAVQYHRKVRRSRSLRSALDDIPGIGPSRRKALLTRFGSVRGVRGATVDELTAVPGVSRRLAEEIVAAMSPNDQGL